MFCDIMKGVAYKVRIVVDIAESADSEISKCVVSRRIVQLGYISPLKPFSGISLIEGNPEVVEKICRSSASGRCEGGFGYDGITFGLGGSGVKQEGKDVPTLSEKPFSRFVLFSHAELHLCDMS
jgi:hypothetical protein